MLKLETSKLNIGSSWVLNSLRNATKKLVVSVLFPHSIRSHIFSSKTVRFDFTSPNVRPICRAKVKICTARRNLAKRHAQATNSFISSRHAAVSEWKHVQNKQLTGIHYKSQMHGKTCHRIWIWTLRSILFMAFAFEFWWNTRPWGTRHSRTRSLARLFDGTSSVSSVTWI